MRNKSMRTQDGHSKTCKSETNPSPTGTSGWLRRKRLENKESCEKHSESKLTNGKEDQGNPSWRGQ